MIPDINTKIFPVIDTNMLENMDITFFPIMNMNMPSMNIPSINIPNMNTNTNFFQGINRMFQNMNDKIFKYINTKILLRYSKKHRFNILYITGGVAVSSALFEYV